LSYDIYCYKSQLGRPDIDEAQSVIEVEENDENEVVESDPATKLKIAKALFDFNPRFESFEFDFKEITELQKISVEEAKEKFNHIELNSLEGDLATQITIFDNNVSITIPYWYSGEKAKTVFDKVSEYTKLIQKTVGYFVYVPQTENVYDPSINNFDCLEVYTSMTIKVEKLKTEKTKNINKKPWWKFW
jgi:hypothetical protein